MKITKSEVFGINEVIEEIKSVIKADFKFNYMLKRNRDKIETVLKKVPQYSPPSTPEYIEYISSMQEKLKKENIRFNSAEEMNDFYSAEIENHPIAKEERRQSLVAFQEKTLIWEKEEVEIVFYTVPIEHFPSNLTFEQFEILSAFFATPEEETVETEAVEVEVKKKKK